MDNISQINSRSVYYVVPLKEFQHCLLQYETILLQYVTIPFLSKSYLLVAPDRVVFYLIFFIVLTITRRYLTGCCQSL